MTAGPAGRLDTAELQARVAAHPFWHQTIEVAPGVTTPGLVDLRPVVDTMPWPEIRSRRCLDVGTLDGFFAFEMERRGAAEVVAVDLDEDAGAGASTDAGFRLVHELIGSKVDHRRVGIADLDPDELGRFDVVVCGGLLAGRPDPVAALEAVRGLTRGLLLSAEPIALVLSIVARGRPLYEPNGGDRRWLPNAAAHRHLLDAAGFDVERVSRPYVVPSARPAPVERTPRRFALRLAQWAATGTAGDGVVHRALLARPRRPV